MVLAAFIGGMFLGLFLGVVTMCLLQVNREHRYHTDEGPKQFKNDN